jgi:hypothetical protein
MIRVPAPTKPPSPARAPTETRSASGLALHDMGSLGALISQQDLRRGELGSGRRMVRAAGTMYIRTHLQSRCHFVDECVPFLRAELYQVAAEDFHHLVVQQLHVVLASHARREPVAQVRCLDLPEPSAAFRVTCRVGWCR